MSKTKNRIRKRKKANKRINELNSNPNNLLVAHYSCESFYNITDGRTPRITSIAIRYFESAQTVSFSIHKVAEKNGISHECIEEQYDDLEKKMLDEYFEFVKTHINFMWVHWNMRDINFGFQAIEHRYSVLGGVPVIIPNDKKFDLARSLVDLYSAKYSGHPRLQSIMKINRITHKDFLVGADEAKAFENKEYIKLHQSTLRKVDIFHSIFVRHIDGELNTNAKLRDVYGISPQGLFELSKDIWWINVIVILITLFLGALLGKIIS